MKMPTWWLTQDSCQQPREWHWKQTLQSWFAAWLYRDLLRNFNREPQNWASPGFPALSNCMIMNVCCLRAQRLELFCTQQYVTNSGEMVDTIGLHRGYTHGNHLRQKGISKVTVQSHNPGCLSSCAPAFLPTPLKRLTLHLLQEFKESLLSIVLDSWLQNRKSYDIRLISWKAWTLL